MICKIDGDKIVCKKDAANTIIMSNTPENRAAVGLEVKPRLGRPPKVIEEDE